MAVNFNKQMIDLVREIRKRAPADEKPGIKLANPELFVELIPWYQKTNDAIVKALVKELFIQAGDGWPARLEPQEAAEAPAAKASSSPGGTVEIDGKRYVTKVYRGQTQLVEVPTASEEAPSKQRIYRGQVVRS